MVRRPSATAARETSSVRPAVRGQERIENRVRLTHTRRQDYRDPPLPVGRQGGLFIFFYPPTPKLETVEATSAGSLVGWAQASPAQM